MESQPKKYSVDKRAAISLKQFQIVKSNFETSKEVWGEQDASDDCSLSIKFATLTMEDDDTVFGLLFEVNLVNENKTFSLQVEAFASFATTGVKVDKEFIDSGLVTGNAPAIVFPYLRTYITNFCQNSGFNPIILPGFNFNQVNRIED